MFHNENNILRNEVAFTNLIAPANIFILFNSLDEKTKKDLIRILCAYTN